MDCCATSTEDVATLTLQDCPRCGTRGRRVKPVTLQHLVREPPDGEHRFCRSPDCEVVYFRESDGNLVLRGAMRVRVGQKERGLDRPLCYCFGYTAADIAAEIRADGATTIPDAITAHCRRGEDRCPETNPQGSCCLGNIRAAVTELQATLERKTP